ncbi:MAG: glycosyltransferase family 4 protein [Rubrivivax sp.]
MRIVVLGLRGFPGVQGGVETHSEQLYTRIAAGGAEVIVLTRRPYVSAPQARHGQVQLLALASPRQKSLEAIVHTFLGVLQARRLRPDILHIHAIGPSLMVPLARLLGLVVITTNHGPDYERQKWNGLARRMLKLGEWLGSRCSNGVIAISEPIAQHLRQAHRCAPAVIPNGVVVRPPAEASDALDRHGLARGRYVLAVGRLVPEKGFHDLLAAFERARLPGWKLVIAGRADHEDDYSRSLQRQAAGIEGVVLAGFVSGEPLRQLYSHAGLFVLPSYHEGLPIALLEAMSFGLPILASGIAANRQVGLPAGRYFAAGDVAALAAALQRQVEQGFAPEQRQRQIEAVARDYHWDRIASSTLDYYRAVLGRTRPA